MKQISSLFADPKYHVPPKRVSERGELLEYFTNGVNASRDGKRFKKLPISAIAVKLQGLKLSDLYYLRSICEDSLRREGRVGWSKTFWGSLKPRSEITAR